MGEKDGFPMENKKGNGNRVSFPLTPYTLLYSVYPNRTSINKRTPTPEAPFWL